MKNLLSRLRFPLRRPLAGFIMLFCAIGSVSADPVRVVTCDEKVQSHKRGVCENHLEADDFRAFAPGVSWYYNWHFETKDLPPSGVAMDYLPMGWGDSPESLAGLDAYLQANKKPRVVLAINEPNLKGQSFLTPEATATLYKKIKDVADKYQLTVVGPNMSLGSPEDSSITAIDPIDQKQVTYTFMIPFLKAFDFFLGDVKPPALAFHTYGSLGEMKWAVESMHKEFNCPLWVTEYAEWNASDEAAERDYLIQATDFLERTPYIQGYAWFKERADNHKISLLEKEPGKLTPLGEAYVALPVHDTDLYYRIPGKLSAGKYVAIDQADVMAKSNNELLVSASAPNATADYNVQVDSAGTYTLTLHVFGTGKIDIMEKDQVLASGSPTGSEVQDLPITVPLPAGPQTLRVRFDASGMIMSSISLRNSRSHARKTWLCLNAPDSNPPGSSNTVAPAAHIRAVISLPGIAKSRRGPSA
jgi:hypothetical protein